MIDEKIIKKPVEKKSVKKPPFYMLQGKALTTKKGILSDGDEIKPEWVHGGKETIENFIRSGYIGKG